MNKMTFSRFKRNGNDVRDEIPLSVTKRGKKILRVRLYSDDDAKLDILPWHVICRRSAVNWRKFFDAQIEQELPSAQAVTLDGAPSFVVKLWRDDKQLP